MVMDDRRIESFKQQLLKLQQEMLDEAENSDDASDVVTLDQTRVGRLSRMDALQGQAMAQEIKRRREIESKKIISALKRIESGDYGYCLECEDDIAIKRLEYNPAVTLCIHCANKNEQ